MINDKRHILASSSDSSSIKVSDLEIVSCRCKKLLGFKFDRNPTFDYHISDDCKKADRQISALVRLTP